MSYMIEKKDVPEENLSSDIREDYTTGDVGNVTATLTANHLFAPILSSSPGVAITLTTPTAVEIVAGDTNSSGKGSGFHFFLRNDGGYGITLAAGTGVTLNGSAIVSFGTSAHFYAILDNVATGGEAVSIHRLA